MELSRLGRKGEGPWDRVVARFVDYYPQDPGESEDRYHESLDNVTPADVYYGRREEILTRREEIKRRTLRHRKLYNLSQTVTEKPSLSKIADLSIDSEDAQGYYTRADFCIKDQMLTMSGQNRKLKAGVTMSSSNGYTKHS